MAKMEGIRRLKPVIEKKRRDRINHNLDALRDLLFKNTADTRLQNPKLEKAEILDLAVEYIKKTTRKTEMKLKPKATQNQSVLSSSAGPIYASDFYGKFKSSEKKEILLKLGVNLENGPTCASKAGHEPLAQTGFLFSTPGQNSNQELLLHPESSFYGTDFLHHSSSPSITSQYNSPPSSPTFTNASCSPSNSPPCASASCPLPPPPDPLSPLVTPFSLHRPVFVPSILPHMTRDFTPPQSPVLALRQEPFPLPNQSAWRPWS